MASSEVYCETTVPAEQPAAKGLALGGCTAQHLGHRRLLLKVLQLVLSFLAFVLEEVVSECTMCGGLYFFEFVSCCAFLLSILILVLYCTPLHDKIGQSKIEQLDLGIISVVAFFLVIASIVFSATSDKTSLENAAVAFGYLASIAFAVDAGLEFYQKQKTKKERQESTANTRNAMENQPLNN